MKVSTRASIAFFSCLLLPATSIFLMPRSGFVTEPPQAWYPPAASHDSLLNFENAVMTHSNLNNMGPDSGDATMVFHNVGTYNGEVLDLVMSVVPGGDYSGNTSKNELSEEQLMGRINFDPDSSAAIRLTIKSSDTGKNVNLPFFLFSIFDIDAGSIAGQGGDASKSAGVESNQLGPMSNFHMDAEADLEMMPSSRPGYITFTATSSGNEADNPSDPYNLDDTARRRAVLAEFRDTDVFYMSMNVTGGVGGRNLLFGGNSALVDAELGACKIPSTWDESSVGIGQEWNGESMVYKNVMSVGGVDVDMSVTLVGGAYQPINPSVNGLTGKLGQINMGLDDEADFEFAFYIAGTQTPFEVRDLFFSFYDIDQEGSEGSLEALTLSNSTNGTYFVSETTALEVTQKNDGSVTFASTAYGSAANNPDTDDADALQLDLAVSLYFPRPVQAFKITYQSKASYKGRNFQFGGMSSLACPST